MLTMFKQQLQQNFISLQKNNTHNKYQKRTKNEMKKKDINISSIRCSWRWSAWKCLTPRKAPGLTCNQQSVLPYSPDNYPVENMWAILKHRVYSTTSVSKVYLLHKIQHVCTKLIESIPKNVQQLCEAKGGCTKYYLTYRVFI